MPLTPAQQRQRALDALTDVREKLDESCGSDGDHYIKAFATAQSNTQRDRLAARVGYLDLIVRRNEQRSDNAI